MSYYAVAKGHKVGIYRFWNDCKEQVIGYKGAMFKKFSTEEDAREFIDYCNNNLSPSSKKNNLNCSISSNASNISYISNVSNISRSPRMGMNILEDKFDDLEVDYFIYTDGSCYNNGLQNSVAGIGIFFEIDDKRNVSKLLTTENNTNNSAELTAIIEAYLMVETDLKNEKKICIVTDSEYSIKCANGYGEKCAKTGWNKNIPNKELVMKLYNIYKTNDNLKLKHIKAHTSKKDIHSTGNANADKLAFLAIKKFSSNN